MAVQNHDIRKIFGFNLKKLRKKAGLSQEVAAQMIGLKQNTWSQYESSKSFPEDDIITEIVKALSCLKVDLFKKNDTYDFHIQDDIANEPNEHYSYGSADKDLLGYLKLLEKSNRIETEVVNTMRAYILDLYKELSDQKDLVIKEKTKLEEFKEMMKGQI